MSLRALRSLLAVAQHGSFVRAAEAVFLTQSAVSLHIKRLETELNVPLFDRSHRTPVLTDAGHRIVERAREIVSLYDGLYSELAEESELAGRLRIGAIQSAFSGVLPLALSDLHRHHPQLRILVSSGLSAELALRLDNGELDAAITSAPVKPFPTGLVATPLYQEGFWIVAPPQAATLSETRILQNYPLIRFDRRSWVGRMIDRELRQLRIEVRTEMELDNRETILHMVESGLGAAIIPLSPSLLTQLSELTCLPFGSPQQRRDVVMLEREDHPGGRRVKAVVNAIRRRTGEKLIHEK